MNKVKKTKKFEGQILIMALVVLMILAIIIVSITNSLIQDTKQTEYNIEYQDFYATSESQILNISQELPVNLDVNSSVEIVENILANSGYKDVDCQNSNNSLSCNIYNNQQENPTQTTVQIEDSLNLENVDVRKDEFVIYTIDPNSTLPSNFDVSYSTDSGASAVEISIDFSYVSKDNSTRYTSIKTIYDPDSPNNQFQQPIDNPLFPIQRTGDNKFKFNLPNTLALVNSSNSYLTRFMSTNPNIKPVGIRFKPIIKSDFVSSITLTVVASNQQNIVQSRKFIATTYKVNANNELFGPQPVVQANIALHKVPSILDYVLRSEGELNNN